MKESSLERKIKREVKKRGGKALKFVSPGTAGVPDRIILLPGGILIFVEVKSPGQKLRPIQEKRKRELEDLGFTVYVVDSFDDFVKEVFS